MKVTHLTSLLTIALVTLFSITTATPAHACSCIAPATPQQELSKFDVVFRGKAEAIKNPVDTTGAENAVIDFTVNVVWKGDVKANYTLQTPGSSAACGVNFEKGKEYIVYASETEGKLSAFLCSRTNLVSNASADLAALGEGETIFRTTTNNEPENITDAQVISAPAYSPISSGETIIIGLGVVNLLILGGLFVYGVYTNRMSAAK